MTALLSNLLAWYATKIKPRLRQEDGATTLEYVYRLRGRGDHGGCHRGGRPELLGQDPDRLAVMTGQSVSRPARRVGERGAVTLYAVVVAVALFVVVGLVVDGGANVHAHQKAFAVAREAARVAAQDISTDDFGGVRLGSRAVAAGEKYMARYGCEEATVTISGRTVTATCRMAYDGIFLPGTYHVTAVGTVTPETVGPR